MVMGAAWEGRSSRGWERLVPAPWPVPPGLALRKAALRPPKSRCAQAERENKAKRLIIKEASKSFPGTEGKESCEGAGARRVPQPGMGLAGGAASLPFHRSIAAGSRAASRGVSCFPWKSGEQGVLPQQKMFLSPDKRASQERAGAKPPVCSPWALLILPLLLQPSAGSGSRGEAERRTGMLWLSPSCRCGS